MIWTFEEKIEYYKGREHEYYDNNEKLVKFYQQNKIDFDEELKK